MASAWAGPASIQGIVKDAQGKPIKGADVRVESRDGKQLFNTVKDRYTGSLHFTGSTTRCLPGFAGSQWRSEGSINTKTKADQATQLNFDLKPVAAGQASTEQKKKKHMVWVPPSTGSHIGGSWVEVADGATEAGALNVKRGSAEELQREYLSRGNPDGGN